MDKKDYHHPNLKQQLLEMAVDLLMEDGIEAFSLRKLATRAGVSHSAPYRHFKNKEGILAELMLEGHKRLRLALMEAWESGDRARPGAAALISMYWAYLDFAQKNPEHLKVMFSRAGMAIGTRFASFPMGADMSEYDSFGVLESAVRACQEEGSLDPAAPADALSMALWAQIHGLSVLRNEGVIAAMAKSRGGTEEGALDAILAILSARR